MDSKGIELKKYPIGKFVKPNQVEDRLLQEWIKSLEHLPNELAKITVGLSEEVLQEQYRAGSWTVRQIIHHIADSHLNGYTRMKLALTEDNPTIRPYDENGWSVLADVESVPVEVSIELLKNLHIRWVALIKGLNTAEMSRTFYHPENKVNVTVADQIGLYAWHGEHHLAHVKEALGL